MNNPSGISRRQQRKLERVERYGHKRFGKYETLLKKGVFAPRVKRKITAQPQQLELFERANKRIQSPQRCAECGQTTAPVWRYLETSVGVAFLCAECKPKVVDRCFPSQDALNLAVKGGGFESSRRRH